MNGGAAEVFGKHTDGSPVYRVRLHGGGLSASIITWGAVLQDLRLEGHAAPLVLGFDHFEDYPVHSSYFGATPGRVANRIGGGAFTLDGKPHQLELNEKGISHLHGGSTGLAKQNWALVSYDDVSAVLQITDPDGRAGYSGNCHVTCTYRLLGDGVLTVTYESEADQPTPCNICNHSYFNLDDQPTAVGHEISIAADHYLPTDESQIPTGEIRPVDGTPFDLRKMGPMLVTDDNGEPVLFDHNFCLSDSRVDKRSVIRVKSPHSGVGLEVRTTEPGVQFYSGYKLNVTVPGLEGRRYGAQAGFCLETQVWPDAINHPNFPNSVLRPGERLVQETDYIFTKD